MQSTLKMFRSRKYQTEQNWKCCCCFCCADICDNSLYRQTVVLRLILQ